MVRPPGRSAVGRASGGAGVTLIDDDTAPTRILVIGVLDMVSAPRLARFLGGLLDDGHRHVDLDLSRLRFLAAAGLTVFAVASMRYEQAGGRLRLTAVPPRIHRILQITGLDTVLDVRTCSAVAAPATPGAGGGDPAAGVTVAALSSP